MWVVKDLRGNLGLVLRVLALVGWVAARRVRERLAQRLLIHSQIRLQVELRVGIVTGNMRIVQNLGFLPSSVLRILPLVNRVAASRILERISEIFLVIGKQWIQVQLCVRVAAGVVVLIELVNDPSLGVEPTNLAVRTIELGQNRSIFKCSQDGFKSVSKNLNPPQIFHLSILRFRRHKLSHFIRKHCPNLLLLCLQRNLSVVPKLLHFCKLRERDHWHIYRRNLKQVHGRSCMLSSMKCSICRRNKGN